MTKPANKYDYKNLDDIPDVNEKLTMFINNLDEELTTWRAYKEKNGKKVPITQFKGYACLDQGKIIAINYWYVPKKFSFQYFIYKILLYQEIEGGAVVKKEYQRQGINTHLYQLREKLMIKKGYRRSIIGIDADNVPALKAVQKNKDLVLIKKTKRKNYYYLNFSTSGKSGDVLEKIHWLRIRIIIEIFVFGLFARALATRILNIFDIN